MNIISALNRFVRDGGLGSVLHAPTGVRLTPDNLLIPDIVFVAQDRRHMIGPKTIDAAPDLVLEILSPGTRRRDLDANGRSMRALACRNTGSSTRTPARCAC